MTYISVELRRLVVERARICCEYCLQGQAENPFSFHIEHIISEKHRRQTRAENLCLSCPDCNAFKGSDIGSIDEDTGLLTFLFNPHNHQWAHHFRLNGAAIEPQTPEGRVTVFLLRLNNEERIAERTLAVELGVYPCQNSE